MTRLVSISEIADVFNGKTPAKAEHRTEGFPVLKIKDVDESGRFRGDCQSFVDISLAEKFRRKWIEQGDILILNAAHNASYVASKSFFAGPEVRGLLPTGEWLLIRTTARDVLPGYVNHWIRTADARQAIRFIVKGIHLYPKDVAKLQIPLPPLDEQRRIVGLLDRAAEIRRRADAARAKARAIIPTLFLDTFGDPAEDWSEITIDDILAKQVNAIRTGPFGSQLKHSEFTDEGVPVLGIDNVVDNEFKWAKPRHLPREKYEAFKRFRVFPGDVIVTIMGTTGRVAVAPDNLPECMNTKHLCAFTLDRSLAHPRFVQGALLFDPGVRAQARGKANGQIMEGWNMGIVRSIRLRLPPLPLQSAFAEQASRIESLARHLDAAAAKAEAMAAGLSAEMFGSSGTSV